MIYKICRICAKRRTARYTCRGCSATCCEHLCGSKDGAAATCGPCGQKTARLAPPSAELKPGDELYHVVEVDLPDDGGIHTWKVDAKRVERVRKDGFAFDRMVGFTTIHRLAVLGAHFHRTPEAAVQAFVAAQQDKIEGARRAISAAERAIAWARSLTP